MTVVNRTGPLDIVTTLTDRLADAGVVYCHWKSNEAIEKSERGENDLDLLISADDRHQFHAVLKELGFIPATPVRSRRVPGIADHYGLDAESGVILHVHAHFRLVIGDDMTKNFHLPVETAYLESRDVDGLIPTPSPEFEYLVFLLRMGVKHCPWDAVAMAKGRLTATERNEMLYLEDRADAVALERVRTEVFPWFDPDAMAEIRAGLEPKADIPTRAQAGRVVLRILRPYARRGGWTDLLLRVVKRTHRRFESRFGISDVRKSLGSAGGLIAVIGSDGAGKSTVVGRLADQLGSGFRSTEIHMGKPDRSIFSRLLRRGLSMLGMETGGAAHPPWDEFLEGPPGAGHLIGNVLVARDRALLARRARRSVATGYIIISDRFPRAELATMDTARNARIADRFPSTLFRWLAGVEGRYHAQIGEPDIAVILRVSPDVAVARRHEQDESFVRIRATEVASVDWNGLGVTVVDADQNEQEVYLDVLAATWQGLIDKEQGT